MLERAAQYAADFKRRLSGIVAEEDYVQDMDVFTRIKPEVTHRELKSDREFAWAVGKEVRCWVREPLEGRRELAGVLVAVTPEALTVAEAGQVTQAVPRRLLDKARLVPVLFPRKQGRS